jgi:hypothetical protein
MTNQTNKSPPATEDERLIYWKTLCDLYRDKSATAARQIEDLVEALESAREIIDGLLNGSGITETDAMNAIAEADKAIAKLTSTSGPEPITEKIQVSCAFCRNP